MSSIKVRIGNEWVTIGSGSLGGSGIKNELDSTKNEILDKVNSLLKDVQDSVSELDEYLESAFRDGIISYAEKIKIESYLKILAINKASLEAKYNEIISDVDLPNDRKETLEATHTYFNVKYEDLLRTIINSIDDSIISGGESEAVDSAFEAFNNAMALFITQMEQSAREIYEIRLQTEKEELRGSIDDVKDYIENELFITNSWVSDVEKEVGELDNAMLDRVTQVQLNEFWANNQGIDTSYATTTTNAMKKDIEEMNGSVKTVYDYLVSAGYEDGILYDVEYTQLLEYIDAMKASYAKIKERWHLISSADELADTNEKVILDDTFTEYTNTFNSLVSLVMGAVSDKSITTDEETALDSIFTELDYVQDLLTASMETCIQKIAKIRAAIASEKANELIKETITASDEHSNTAIDLIATITMFIENAFSNGILGEDEKNFLNNYLVELDGLYNSEVNIAEDLLANEYLEYNNQRVLLQTRLNQLKSEYENFINQINEAVTNNTITSVVSSQIKAQGEIVRVYFKNMARVVNLAVNAIGKAMVEGIADVSAYWGEIKKQETKDYVDELKEGIDASIDEVMGATTDASNALTSFKNSSSIQSLGKTQLQAYISALATVKGAFDVIYKDIVDNGGVVKEYTKFNSEYTNIVTTINNLLANDTLLDVVTFNEIDTMLQNFNTTIDTTIDSLNTNAVNIKTVLNIQNIIGILKKFGEYLNINMITDYSDFKYPIIINNDNGTEGSGGDVATGYIEIEGSKKYNISVGENFNWIKIIFYDEDKVYISCVAGSSSANSKIVDSPLNAKYVRVSGNPLTDIHNMDGFSICRVSDTKTAFDTINSLLSSEASKGIITSSDLAKATEKWNVYCSQDDLYITELEKCYEGTDKTADNYVQGITDRFNLASNNFPSAGNKYLRDDFNNRANYIKYLRDYIETVENNTMTYVQNYHISKLNNLLTDVSSAKEEIEVIKTFFTHYLEETRSIENECKDNETRLSILYKDFFANLTAKSDENKNKALLRGNEIIELNNEIFDSTTASMNSSTIRNAYNAFNTDYTTFDTAVSNYNTTNSLANVKAIENSLIALIESLGVYSYAVSDIGNSIISAFTESTNSKLNNLVTLHSKATLSNMRCLDTTINSKDDYLANLSLSEQYSGIYWKVSDLSVASSSTYTLRFKLRKTDGTLLNIGGHIDGSYNNYKLLYIDGEYVDVNFTYSYDNTKLLDDGLWHTFVCTFNTSETLVNGDRIFIQPNRGKTTAVTVDIKDLVIEDMSNSATNFITYSNRLKFALEQTEKHLISMYNSVCVSDLAEIKNNINLLKEKVEKLKIAKDEVMNHKYLTEEYVSAIYDDMRNFTTKLDSYLTKVNNCIKDSVILQSEVNEIATSKNEFSTSHDTFSVDMYNAIIELKNTIASTMDSLITQLAKIKEDFNEGISKTIKSLASYLDASITIRTELAKLDSYIVAYKLEQTDLTARYNQIYYNSYLSQSSKTRLAECKTLLDTAYNIVIELINDALLNNNISEDELEAILNAMSDYNVQVGAMSKLLQECVDEISQNKLEGIYVGTRNLIFNSTFNDGVWNEDCGWESIKDDRSNLAKAEQKGLLEDNVLTMTSNKFIVYKEDNFFTFSLNFKVEDFKSWDNRFLFRINFYGGNDHSTILQYKDVYLSDLKFEDLSNNQWYRFFYTCELGNRDTLNINDATKQVTRGSMTLSLIRNGSICVKECKAERSSIPSEWSPAPEDDYSAILSLAGRVTEFETIKTDDAIIDIVTQSDAFNFAFEGMVTVDDLKNYITSSEAKGEFDSINNRFNALDYISEAEVDSKLIRTAESITSRFKHAGGVNLIKNSVGYDGLTFWDVYGDGEVKPIKGILELEQKGAGSAFRLTGVNTISQDFYHWIGDYTVHLLVKKGKAGTGYVKVIDEDEQVTQVDIEERVYDYEKIEIHMSSSTLSAKLEIHSNSGEIIVTSIMAHFGDVPLQWTHRADEIYNDNVIMNRNGIKVTSSSTDAYTSITTEEFAGYDKVVDEETGVASTKKIFCLNGDTTEVNKLKAEKSVTLHPIKLVRVNSDMNKGIAFISSIDDIIQ